MTATSSDVGTRGTNRQSKIDNRKRFGTAIKVTPTTDVGYCDEVLRRLWSENWFDGCRPPGEVTVRGAMGRPEQLFLAVSVLGVPGGYFRFEQTAPGLWECHSQLLQNCRGLEAMEAYRQGLRYMFVVKRAHRLTGYAPRYQRHAVWMAVRMGFKIERRTLSPVRRNNEIVEMKHYAMTRERWKEIYG